jgi:ATP-dependent DNA helicase RecG
MTDPLIILAELRALPHETEWAEFKTAATDFDSREICRYVSALANEANLAQRPWGWLVFGIHNETHVILGTAYRRDPARLDSLKHEVAQQLTDGHTIAAIHDLTLPEGRVLLFQIPPAPQGHPIAYQGHFYGRAGESLGALTLEELDRIRQPVQEDWSAVLCPQASFADLEPAAVARARTAILARLTSGSRPIPEAQTWSDVALLDKARLTVDGKITRTALVLLGKPEAAHHLAPAVPQLTWKLEGEKRAYEHFYPPFLLTVEDLYQRIRNVKQRIEVPDRLVPIEVETYDRTVVLEALHNAIAHQDYRLGARVLVTERPDRLEFANEGGFFAGTVEDYLLKEQTPSRYRNPHLARAMVTLNMIDTMGYGIRRMFEAQRSRGFPLPDFTVDVNRQVRVTIHGQVIDWKYTALLLAHADLPLSTILLLDRVQKGLPIAPEGVSLLRRQHLVEGRSPQVRVAARIAAATGTEVEYIRARGLDDQHFKGLVLGYLDRFGSASRAKLDAMLMDKLPTTLDEAQKRNRIRNLLYQMSRVEGTIRNDGPRGKPKWVRADTQISRQELTDLDKSRPDASDGNQVRIDG